MIQMWDELFITLDCNIKTALGEEPARACRLMHEVLNPVWQECFRVLRPGSFLCLNIGDATRTVNKKFNLYPNHSTVTSYLLSIGFDALPCIIWRKPSNSPNKFMGSGMLPVAAYVTLEHEYILIFKKPGKRDFTHVEQKQNRRRSAYLWSDRNIWFSDIWDFTGIRQDMDSFAARSRSAAYPLELPYRLIQMFSVYGDTVFDPFWGTGTTTLAALICGRSSVGYELDENLVSSSIPRFLNSADTAKQLLSERIKRHQASIKKRKQNGKSSFYKNESSVLEVITAQEQNAEFYLPNILNIDKTRIVAEHIKYLPGRK